MTTLDLRRWSSLAAVCASLLAGVVSDGASAHGCVLLLGQVAALCGRADARAL